MKNRNKRPKGKSTEADDEEEDDVINCGTPPEGGQAARKGTKGSDKVSNRKQPSAETLDLFALPDFEDNDDDADYETPTRKRGSKRAVPLIKEDEDKNNNNKEGEDDDDEDEHFQADGGKGDDDQEEEEEEEEDDEEITLQKGKVDERRKKKMKGRSGGADMIMEERPKGGGQCCANVDQATEFRKYIWDVMKIFEGHVKKGKQVKKYLLEMIEDICEECMNMRYPGMDSNPEEIVQTIADPSFKAWQTMLSGVEYVDRNDLKEANTKRTANIVTSDRSNKDAGQVARATFDSLPTAQKNNCKQMLKQLVKHNTEAHESAAKAGRALMRLLDYFPISAWLQVADAMTRPLVYVQVPEVVEIVKQAQAVINKKQLQERESPIDEIVIEQKLLDMMLLRHIWGYGTDDVGKKMVLAIIYKYLKERMFPKVHVMTAFLSIKFTMTSSTLHKYIVGMKFKGGAQPGTKYRQAELEEWTGKQREDDKNKGASGSGTSKELQKGKGMGKKSGKMRDAAEICGDASKPKRKRHILDDDNDDEDEDHNRPLKAPVMAKGLIIPN